jgi:aminoglycoside phosphotransferase (APT) family kinase protein
MILAGGYRAFFKAERQTPGMSWSLALEAWALGQAARVGIPVPKVMGVDCSEKRFPFRWLLLSAVPGVHLTEAALESRVEADVLRHCGALMVRLHAVLTDGFGPLDDELFLKAGAVSGTHKSWREIQMEAAQSDARALVREGLLSRGQAARCLSLVEGRVPDLRQGHLIHGDFDRGHVFVDPSTGTLTGIIDFGARESADPEWELSWPSIFDGEETAARIKEGYLQAGGSFDSGVLGCYILARLLWLLGYRHRRGDPSGVRAAREQLLRVLDE